MTKLVVELPDEAADIPDLDKSIAWFVGEQIKIAQWRGRRFDGAVNGIVDQAFEQAEQLKKEGMEPNEAKEEFIRLCQENQG